MEGYGQNASVKEEPLAPASPPQEPEPAPEPEPEPEPEPTPAPAPAPAPPQYLLCFKDQSGAQVGLLYKSHNMPLDKAFRSYAHNKKLDLNSLRFMLDGSRVHGNQSLNDLSIDVEDFRGEDGHGHLFEVVMEQIGGASS